MSDLEGTVIHDLAGSMTSITGLAEIISLKPDLPKRESLIATLAEEARTATRAVRDLQIVRSIAAGSLPESIVNVELFEVFRRAAGSLSRGMARSLHGLGTAHSARADVALLADLVARVVQLGGDGEEPPTVEVGDDDGSVSISITIVRFDLDELQEGRVGGKKLMRPLALADLLLPRWGGRLELGIDSGVPYVRFLLASA